MRVNIESEAFWDRRIDRFAKFLGLPKWQSWGALLNLWHISQHELRSSGTKEEIVDWISVDDLDWEEKVFSSLLMSKLIQPIESSDLFLIVGNEKQIESLKKIRDRAQKGGEATKKKWKKVKDDKVKGQSVIDSGQSMSSSQEDYKPALSPAQAGKQPPEKQASTDRELEEGSCNANVTSLSISYKKATSPPQADSRPSLSLVQAGNEQAAGLANEGSKQAHCKAQAGLSPSTGRPNTIQCNTIHYNSNNKGEVNPQHSSTEEAKPPMPSANAPGSPPSIGSRSKIPKIWEERITGFDRQMADKWMAFSKEQIPTGKFNLLQFQVAIARMRHDFNLDQEKIEQILEWIRHDDFWSTNAISPMESLRRKNGICKLERILVAMDAPPRAASSSRAQNQPLKPPNQRMLDAIKAGEETVAKWLRGEVEPIRDDEDLGVLA